MTNSRTGSSCYWGPFPVKEKVVCAQSFIKSCTTCCVASVLLVWLSQNGKHSSIRDAHNPTWGIVHGNTLGGSFKPRHSVIKEHIVVTSSKRTASELFAVQMACRLSAAQQPKTSKYFFLQCYFWRELC